MRDYLNIIKKINSKSILQAKIEINEELLKNPKDSNLYHFLGICNSIESNLENAIFFLKNVWKSTPGTLMHILI